VKDKAEKPEKVAKPAAAPKAEKPAKPEKPAKVVAEKPAKAEKPPKPAKAPKPPKPPKLAPVAAAFAGPIPSKPLAVAAGRAQPVTRAPIAAPVRAAPKPLAAPKPVQEAEVVGDSKAVPAFKAKANGKGGMVMVGAIAGAFGVKGEVRLRAFTEKKDGVISYGPLYGEDGKLLLKPKSWRELNDGVAVVAAEIKTKEEADALKGVKLFVPRANLPATDEDEFYIVDLLGCKAESLDGQVLGVICAVWNFGAGDIIEYRPPNGAPNVRITFTKETAPLVDLAGKRVVLDPPPPEPANGK
jgi:16S rRNA processing protein RimM